MARVTYIDLERAAPYISFHGYDFTTGQPVEIPDDADEVLDILRRHPWFKVEAAAPPKPGQAPDKPAPEEENAEEDEEDEEEQPREEEKPQPESPEKAARQLPPHVERIRAHGETAGRAGTRRRVPSRYASFRATWLEAYDHASGY